ncbi:TPA: hypothetical protein N0F65_002263 [Lagenidium giganteum]|uniref:N-acetyltransferase domain-containing protein n=1 Tax=Lagenidium giganteum TaxID=4803 RepID=A0AAV2YQH3_9STRA|nr:TPA: hypothetical protein N0F65_002263 [Lagenidium giganteum]
MPLIVKRIETQEEQDASRSIRVCIFVKEQNFPTKVENDDLDFVPSTVHLIGIDSTTGEYVAVARCVVDPEKRVGLVGRVGVSAAHRGKGLAAKLMIGMEPILHEVVDCIVIEARDYLVDMYQRCGYECTTGDVLYDEDIDANYCVMTKDITAPNASE